MTISRIDPKYDLAQMIKGVVHFEFYREGNLYYQTSNGVTFPVPIDDAGSATFLYEDRGILFMRWMRKFIETATKETNNDSDN